MKAAIYRRISDDREGEELGVQRQAEDLDDYAATKGYEVVETYVDNDISASTRTRTVRPDYQRMLRDARAGKFQVVLAYTAGRVTRRPRENEDLIELAEECGIRFDYIRSPSFDLNSADGRMIARMLAAQDAAEVERTAERVARAAKQRAEKGESTGGPRPFGWESRTGPLVPAEAKLIEAGVNHVMTGGHLNQLVPKWNASGVRHKAKEWNRTSIRGILLNPRIAGIAVYHGEPLRDSAGAYVMGKWEPIIDIPTYEALRERLTANPRKQPYRSYLLSGLLRCECGVLMYGNGRGATRTGHTYVCQRQRGGCGHVVTGSVDLLMEKWALRKLEGLTRELSPTLEWDGEEELADASRQAEEVRYAYRQKILPASAAFPMMAELEERIETLKRQRAAATRQQLPPQDARAMWKSNEIAQKREVLRRLLVAVVVKRNPLGQRGGPKFDPSRLDPIPRESSVRREPVLE